MSSEGIFVAAAPGTSWPLALDSFESQLRGRWPEVRTWSGHERVTNHDYVEFTIELEGYARTGTYFDGFELVLSDGTIELWADTIEWFLSLLPPAAGAVCMLEAVPEVTPLPRNATADQIVAILDDLNNQ